MKFVVYYGMDLSSNQKQKIASDCDVSVKQLITGSFENHKGYLTPIFFSDEKSKDDLPYKASFKLNLTKVFKDLGETPPVLKSDSNYSYAYATINFEKSSQRKVVEKFTQQEDKFDEKGKLFYKEKQITSPLVIKKGGMVLKITGKTTSKQGFEYYKFKVISTMAEFTIENIHCSQNESHVNEENAPQSMREIFFGK